MTLHARMAALHASALRASRDAILKRMSASRSSFESTSSTGPPSRARAASAGASAGTSGSGSSVRVRFASGVTAVIAVGARRSPLRSGSILRSAWDAEAPRWLGHWRSVIAC